MRHAKCVEREDETVDHAWDGQDKQHGPRDFGPPPCNGCQVHIRPRTPELQATVNL